MVLLLLLVAAAIAAGIPMIDLFRRSATAQASRAQAEIGRACDAIAGAYRCYSAGSRGSPADFGDEAAHSAAFAAAVGGMRLRFSALRLLVRGLLFHPRHGCREVEPMKSRLTAPALMMGCAVFALSAAAQPDAAL